MMRILYLLILILLSSSALASRDLGAAFTGLYATVVVHEAGHAVTAKMFGHNVDAFKPYPTKMKYRDEEGTIHEKWVAGYVSHSPRAGEKVSATARATISAMGSGANIIAVLALAPLLPEVNGFGADALDQMLVFGTLDLPGYALGDAIGLNDGIGDWNQVAKATDISIWWFVLGGIAEGFLLNEYREHWLNKVPEENMIRRNPSAPWSISASF
jgi:hypothetical protein